MIKRSVFDFRVFRCKASDYRRDEILLANETHTTGQLRAIANTGFNGIWLRARLRDLVPGELFVPYVRKSQQRVAELLKLCRRARRHGLDIWLYCTEPLGLPETHRFWRYHPELVGHRTKLSIEPTGSLALCPSTAEVQRYLAQGFRQLFHKVPLKGVILITASEMAPARWCS